MGEMKTPEAFHCVSGTLPHLREDLDERFPKALAGPSLEDDDPPANGDLELCGERIGKQGVRFR